MSKSFWELALPIHQGFSNYSTLSRRSAGGTFLHAFTFIPMSVRIFYSARITLNATLSKCAVGVGFALAFSSFAVVNCPPSCFF